MAVEVSVWLNSDAECLSETLGQDASQPSIFEKLPGKSLARADYLLLDGLESRPRRL